MMHRQARLPGRIPTRPVPTHTIARFRKPFASLLAFFLLFQWSIPAFAQTQASPPPSGTRANTASSQTSGNRGPQSATPMSAPEDGGEGTLPGTFTVQAFQTDLFTGAATATIPIVVPPGTGGVAPKIVLRYNSGTVDDLWMADNHPPLDQAAWTGLGWTLDVGGMILRNPNGTPDNLADDTLKLVFDGAAHDLVLVDAYQWIYHTKDEKFWRLQYDTTLDEWRLWTKDGTLHRFGSTRDGKGITYFADLSRTYTYKYLLDEVSTPGGTGVRYAYYRQQATSSSGRTYDRALYPDRITYTYLNGNLVGDAREVRFLRTARTDYTDTTATTQFSYFEDQRLEAIEVRAGSQFVRKYALGYDYSIDRDPTYTWGGGATGDLTLRSVTQFGTDESSTLPPLTFTYSGTHLVSVSNRFGGTVTYTYDPGTNPIWSATSYNYFYGYCGEFGVRTNRGPAACAGYATLMGHALRTNEAGTIPLYSVCAAALDYGTYFSCSDYAVANSPGPYPESAFARLVGHVSSTSQPGTRPLYSNYKSSWQEVDPNILHCADWGVSDIPFYYTCTPPSGGWVLPSLVGYISLNGTDRSRVITRSVDDGRGTIGTTSYAYGTPQWGGPNGNEFWGHDWVRITDPAGHYTDLWFHQDEAKKGRAYKVETHRSDGALFSKVENTWTTSTPYPGVTVVALTQADGYTFDGDSSYKQTRRTLQYDGYGNVTQIQHAGDVAVSGDERTEVLEYAYNPTAYIVGLPSHTLTRDASDNTVAAAWLYYDAATSYTTPPTVGRLTKTCRWRDGGTNPCVELTYDDWGNVHTVQDARGNITTLSHDTFYRTFPESVTTPATPNAPNGLTAAFTYDARFGVVLTATDPNGQTTTNQYDVFGRLTSTTNALQETRTFSYDALGTVGSQRITIRLPDGSPGGLWTEVYFDGLGRTFKVRKKAPVGQVILLETAFDTRRLVSGKSLPRFEGANAEWITFSYDALARPVQTTFPDSTTQTLAYNDWTITATDRNGHAWTTVKDAYSRTIQVTEPGGAITHYASDALDRLIGVTDAAGNVTSILYDTLGRKIQMTEPNMGTWTYGYDANGNLLSQTDAKGQTLTFTYDALNRLATKTYPGPDLAPLTGGVRSTPTGYLALYRGGICVANTGGSCIGGDARVETGLGAALGYMKASSATGTIPVYGGACYSSLAGLCTDWSLSLTANGSPLGYLSLTAPDSQSQNAPFIQSGGLLYQGLTGTPSAYLWTSPSGSAGMDHFYTTDGTTPAGYTGEGLLGYLTVSGGSGTVALTRYFNATTESHYYSTTSDAPAGYTTEATLGYLQTSSGSGLAPLARHYNASTGDYRLTTSTTPPSGYTYQATLGYLRLQSAGQGGTIAFIYDTGPYGKGHRTGLIDFAGSASYNFDALGRPTGVTRVTDGVAYTTQTTYTALGQVDKLTYPDGEEVTYTYDAGQITSVVGAGTYASGITYDAAGQVTQLTYGNGAVRTQTYSPTTFRLTGLVTTKGATTLQSFSYAYDNVGNLTTLADNQTPANSQAFAYDSLDRLTGATGPYGSPSYSYNAIGNILTKASVTYTYGATGQTCGRLMPHAVTSTSDGKSYSYDCNGNLVADGDRTLTWDADNKPVSITRTGVGTTTLDYSGDGARVKKQGPAQLIRYASRFEDHATDGVQIKHVGVGGLRIATRVVGGIHAGTYSTQGDHLGSLNVLTNSSGTEVQRLTYRPFGETFSNTGTVDFDRLRFTGQEEDPETGLYYYGARYYNPALGRFISPDSMVPRPDNPQNLNRYSYVRNNPVNLVDPTGHYSGDETDRGDNPDSGFSNLGVDCQTEVGDPNPSPPGPSATPTAPAVITDSTWTASLYETPPFETLDTVRVTPRPVPSPDEPGRVIERTLIGRVPGQTSITGAPVSPAISPTPSQASPRGGFSVVVGGTVTASTPLGGGDVMGGVAFGARDVGVFGGVGPSFGLNANFNVFAGVVFRDPKNLSDIAVTVAIGPVVGFLDKFGNVIGGALSYTPRGYGFTGASASFGLTGALSVCGGGCASSPAQAPDMSGLGPFAP